MKVYQTDGRMTAEASSKSDYTLLEMQKLLEALMFAGFSLREAELTLIQNVSVAASLIVLDWKE